MSSSAKFGFRPRALDVTKKLPIRIRKCRKRSPKVKRTVAVAPSGMEKEEEMESHLQQAILAQKATSAGDSVENHVIPTPRVSSINEDEYNRIYQTRCQKNKKLIIFDDHVPFFLTQGSYNADSEDEDWLNAHRSINVDDFEHIIEKLESASHTDIIQPRNARVLLNRYDSSHVDDVYDYWLQKRQKAASRKGRCKALMPKICTEIKREEKSIINPYVAFRRRLDKVQTRKKQKAELMTYEKLLQLNLILKRSIVLINTISQRDRLKLTLSDLDYSIFQLQLKKKMSNQDVDEIAEQVHRQQQKQRRASLAAARRGVAAVPSTSQDADITLLQSELTTTPTMNAAPPPLLLLGNAIPDERTIHMNIELWNAASQIGPPHATLFPIGADDSAAEVEKIAAVDQSSSVDGRYQFKRKAGCRYHAAIPMEQIIDGQTLPPPSEDELIFPLRYLSTKFTTEIRRADGSSITRVGFTGKRMGRGGRRIIDLCFLNPPSKSLDLISP